MKKFLRFLHQQEHRLIGATSILILGLLIAKALGFIKLRLYLEFFGVGKELDIFFGAGAIPDLFANLIMVGVLSLTLVPFFVNKKKDAHKFVLPLMALSVFVWLVLWFVLSMILRGIFYNPHSWNFLSTFFGVNQQVLANSISSFLRITKLLFIPPMFLIAGTVLSYYLHSQKKFWVSSVGPIMFNLGILLGLIGFKKLGLDNLDVLVYSLVFGGLLFFAWYFIVFLIIQVKNKELIKDTIFSFKLVMQKSFYKQIFKLVKQSSLRAVGVFFEQAGYLITIFWIVSQGTGMLTSFKYAETLRLLFVQIVVISMAQAFFPSLNQWLAEDKQKFYTRVKQALLFLGAISVLMGIVYLLGGKFLIKILYSGKNVQMGVVNTIYIMLAWSVPLMIAQSFVTFLNRVYFAKDDVLATVYVGIWGLFGRLLVAIPLSLWFYSHNIMALAPGFSKVLGYILGVGIVYTLSALFLMVKLRYEE